LRAARLSVIQFALPLASCKSVRIKSG
jgi:hypothetical protein